MMEENQEFDLVELWEKHVFEKDESAREQLIIYYTPLVKRVVGRLGIPETAAMETQDLISYGISGLLEAIDRYDPGREASFETFATQRIRGSVLDTLRKHDYVSRTVRRRSAEIEAAVVELRNQLGRLPTDEEVARHLDMDIDTYREILSQANLVFLSLDSPFSAIEGEGEMVLGEALEDTHMREIMAEVEEQDLHRELVNAIQELPEREQIILALYYYEELTVREVAEVMNLSPSRISQIMARSLMMLRARLMYDLAPSESRRRPDASAADVGSRGASRDRMYADSRYGVYERGAI